MSLNAQLIDPANYELYTCSCCAGILVDPYQLLCGDRICYSCIDSQEKRLIECIRCGEVTEYEQCHEDKACFKDLPKLLVKCRSPGCKWTGKYIESKKHGEECDYVVEQCEYCGRSVTRAEMRGHLNLTNYEDGCNLLPRPCLFQILGCNFEGPIYRLKRHEDEERQYHHYLSTLSHCGRSLTRTEMREHLNLTNYEDGYNLLCRPCLFQIFGCNFEGPIYRLKRHEDEERQYHYYLSTLYHPQ